MPRSIWKGSIAFGLVNIPVSLTSAETRPDIQLHMVDSSNHARIRYERVNADTGEEVPWDRMVKGYEHEDGQFILLTEEDLAAVQPKLTKTIEITEFVMLDDIDPVLFDKPYYLEPDKRGRKAYALLREALRSTGKAGISKVVIRTREYLSALFVREDALMIMLLRFPQEIRATAKLELPPSDSEEWQPAKKEMDLATRLIDEMTEKWTPNEFHDEYRSALMEFIEKKVAGGESVDDVVQAGDETEERDGSKVLDLADYLSRSFKKLPSSRRKSKPAIKRVSLKKNASKKVTAKKNCRSA
jgi:DNA end-binding protein Ku